MEPQMNTDEHGWNSITRKVIGGSMRVHNYHGCGFLEKVYENSLLVDLLREGLKVEQQKPFAVRYGDVVVGNYECDLLVEGLIIVEVKAVEAISDVHKAQCINYLRVTGLPICLLINFARPKLQIKRFMGPAAQRLPS